MFAAHSRQFDFDDEAAVGGINIGVGDPMGSSGIFPGARDRAGDKMHRRTDFAHGHVRKRENISRHQVAQVESSHFYQNFRSLAFASTKDNRVLRDEGMVSGAAAMCIAFETEFAAAEL